MSIKAPSLVLDVAPLTSREPQDIIAWAQKLSENILFQLNNGVPRMRLQELHVAPSKPRTGDLAFADGTDWAPSLSGKGLHFFDGTNWRPCEAPHASKAKETDEARTSTTTLANDASIAFPVQPNTRYSFRATVFYSTPAAADFQFAWSGPAAPTFVTIASVGGEFSAGAENFFADQAFGVAHSMVGSSTAGRVNTEGTVQTGASGGTVAFQWAQNTSNAGATTVLAGSWIDAGKIG